MSQSANLTVVARAHWVNAWVLIPASRPFVRVDGAETALHWGESTTVNVSPGHHSIETFFRYRGTRSALGTGRLELDAAPGQTIDIEARNGVMNQTPLTPRVVDREPGR